MIKKIISIFLLALLTNSGAAKEKTNVLFLAVRDMND